MTRSHTPAPGPVFLTAEWRWLTMLNYEIDPEVLRPYIPTGTQLDDWQGRHYVSVVGFLFLDTRVWGFAIPFHRNFEEVNLRFYVRRQAAEGWRRGVVFIRELAPRFAICLTARVLYNEQYLTVPMGHQLAVADGAADAVRGVSYWWRYGGREDRISVNVDGDARAVDEGSHEAFITGHYWGYSRLRNGATLEYRVEHRPWRIWKATEARLDCDVKELYGREFAECLSGPPASAFLLDGSPVTVFKGTPPC